MTNYTLKPFIVKPSSQSKRYGVIKLAQDVHAHFVVSCIQEEGQQPKAPRKRDLQSHLAWVAQLVAQSEKVYSCYEAGPTGFSLHRQLSKLGVENIVVAPTCLDEQGKRVNNDKTDTLHLAGRLDRYVAGNRRIFTVVRIPTEAEEQRRAWPRQRKQLQEQRLSLASQGRSLVLTQGSGHQQPVVAALPMAVASKDAGRLAAATPGSLAPDHPAYRRADRADRAKNPSPVQWQSQTQILRHHHHGSHRSRSVRLESFHVLAQGRQL
jgi:transposase